MALVLASEAGDQMAENVHANLTAHPNVTMVVLLAALWLASSLLGGRK